MLLKPVRDKLHDKLMPDRLFSVLFLMQCILVAAGFLVYPALFLSFYFYSVFIRCREYMGFFLSVSLVACTC